MTRKGALPSLRNLALALALLGILGAPGCAQPVGVDGGSLDGGSIDAAPSPDVAVSPDAARSDVGLADTGALDADLGDAHVDPADTGTDAGCAPTGACAAGESDCVDTATARRCLEVRPCELDWMQVACPAGETCALRLDGRRDCGRPEELACEHDFVPTYGFRCRNAGDSYCTPDHLSSWVCGEADGDACLEAIAAPCAADEECTNNGFGACACVSRCTAGARRCGADLVSEELCEDTDGDGCFEWHLVRACPAAETCLASSGMCSTSCADDCGTVGMRGCYRSPISVRECGFFDGDSCRDFRVTECTRERPICDTATVSCVECLGGIDCAPAIEVCRARTCTPPPGTCFEGSGASTQVPVGTAPGRITVFVGVNLSRDFPPSGVGYLQTPGGDTVSFDLGLLRDGYVDSAFVALGDAQISGLAPLASSSPVGAWTLTLVGSFGNLPIVRWAVCVGD